MIYATYDRSAMVEVNGRKDFFQPSGVVNFEVRRLASHVEDDVDFGVVLENDANFTTWEDANPGLATVIADVNTLFTEGWKDTWTPRVWDNILVGRGWSGASEGNPWERYEWMLSRLKVDFYNAADARTRDLIAQGFEYPAASGQMFSLSPEAQIKWTAMYVARALLTYPVLVVTADEQTTVSLADAAAIEALYTQMVEAVRGHIDGGRALKNTLRDASLADEYAIIAASVDNR
jgi:hypothetical protein